MHFLREMNLGTRDLIAATGELLRFRRRGN